MYIQDMVLVHELVHYRFPYMTHGHEFDQRAAEFDQRINEILAKGKTFESQSVREMIRELSWQDKVRKDAAEAGRLEK
jgi:hypothetical protein